MRLPQYQIDAFSDRVFGGNPAAVVPLAEWLPDATLQAIAMENQLSETAFVVAEFGTGHYALRWFTPTAEVSLCGHATLASAHALWEEMGERAEALRFATRSGTLGVTRADGLLWMDFPARPAEACETPAALSAALGATPQVTLAAEDWLVVLADAAALHALRPDMRQLAQLPRRGVIATAPAEASSGTAADCDFLSRFFAPGVGIDEDPVTGSAHCTLAPYWGARLQRERLRGYQASARGGIVDCVLQGERVRIGGSAVTFSAGEIRLPD